jgi:hypothetical protein
MEANTDLRTFAFNPAFRRLLEANWKEHGYHDDSTGLVASPGILVYLLQYHVYAALLGDHALPHRERAEALARHLASRIRTDGLTIEPDGSANDHPAGACHNADALGTFVHYAPGLGWSADAVTAARDALIRIVEHHPVVRLPNGVVGRTQQMRFELRAWYWAWRVTGDEKYRDACLTLWENGIHAYQHIVAEHGQLLQPSLHPDFTWNYACGAGTTTEYATNSHTPVYYCTEPQGFGFVYHHGLKEGVFEPNPRWDDFCRRFFLGLLRNLSRAGHTSSDLDGYGVHRAWYGGCLIESSPVEAAALGAKVGLADEQAGWFRWYVDRYTDFLRRSPSFEQTGLVEHQPYGHNITVEKQFPVLMGARFYAHLVRALHEYELDAIKAVEPPALAHYAWWHNWLRLSAATYETSFVGTTSRRDLPKVRHFGDPNLGCLHGGSPLASLFVGNRLLYATANDPSGLWHVELTDYNGGVTRSCATSFQDETSMTVKTADGRLLNRDCFIDHGDPVIEPLHDAPTEVVWTRRERGTGLRFFVHNRYQRASFSARWGASFPAGIYIRSAVFNIPVPATLNPEVRMNGRWEALADGWSASTWPEAIRWGDAQAAVEITLTPESPEAAGGARAQAVPTTLHRPGGENSFCPFPVLQLSLEAAMTETLSRLCLDMSLLPRAED